MAYQIWELDSRNCVAEFPTQDAAFAAVREMVMDFGASYADSLAVVFEDDEGDTQMVAAGAELAARAEAASPRRKWTVVAPQTPPQLVAHSGYSGVTTPVIWASGAG